jgi:hypothetical protein
MGNLIIKENSNFENVINVVDEAFMKRKSKNTKVNFSKLLESIYREHKDDYSFGIFDSVFEFKTRVFKFVNKRKSENKRNKEKTPPSGIKNWKEFWEHW